MKLAEFPGRLAAAGREWAERGLSIEAMARRVRKEPLPEAGIASRVPAHTDRG